MEVILKKVLNRPKVMVLGSQKSSIDQANSTVNSRKMIIIFRKVNQNFSTLMYMGKVLDIFRMWADMTLF